MGLTPVSGLPGATRAGDVDGSMIFHYLARNGQGPGHGKGRGKDKSNVGRMSHEKLQGVEVQVTRAEEILNKQSGWKSMAGTTDFGDIVRRRNEGKDEWAKLAYDVFIDRILSFLGAYFVKLQGKVDALVFAGGIGERSVEVRESVVRGAGCLGFGIDEGKNEGVRKERKERGESLKVLDVSPEERKGPRTLVCWTDEQVRLILLRCCEVK